MNIDYVKQKSEFFKNSFSFLIKTPHFTPKWNFLIQVNILISCPSLSSVLHKKYRKIRQFSQVKWLLLHDLHFFYFDRSSHISHFFISVIFWSNFKSDSHSSLKQFQLMNLVRLSQSFTHIPHSSYLSLFSKRIYKWYLGIVSFFFCLVCIQYGNMNT